MPKFTIITISYNSAEFIEDTIVSVLSQTYKNFEYIIIDGDSNDGTLEIIKKYHDKLNFLSEMDNGIYDAFNKGINISKGEYICFLNAGDLYEDNYLEIIANEIGNYEVVSSNIMLLDSSKRILRPNYPKCNFGRQPFLHPALVVRRSIFQKIGYFNLQFKVFGDFEWMIRLTKNNFTYKYLNISKVYFDTSGKSSKYCPFEYFYSLYLNDLSFTYSFLCFIRYTAFYIFNRFYKFGR